MIICTLPCRKATMGEFLSCWTSVGRGSFDRRDLPPVAGGGPVADGARSASGSAVPHPTQQPSARVCPPLKPHCGQRSGLFSKPSLGSVGGTGISGLLPCWRRPNNQPNRPMASGPLVGPSRPPCWAGRGSIRPNSALLVVLHGDFVVLDT